MIRPHHMATERVLPSSIFTANGSIGQVGSNSVYYGYTITTVTAVGAINIRKGGAIGGQIIDVIPSGTAVGAVRSLAHGLQADSGIFIEFNGGATGGLLIHYE